MTRCSICPSVSFERNTEPRPWRRARPPFATSIVSRCLKAWKLVMTIFARSRVAQHVAREELAAAVVAVRVIGLEHAEAILDGDAGRDDQEAPGEAPAGRVSDSVDRLPGR